VLGFAQAVESRASLCKAALQPAAAVTCRPEAWPSQGFAAPCGISSGQACMHDTHQSKDAAVSDIGKNFHFVSSRKGRNRIHSCPLAMPLDGKCQIKPDA
jgi:hypothetical protein